ncbi:MAG: hypothetical protein AAGC80_03420 [Rhodococcus sp. (in: high G+C Gram-positive bacteria)]
MDFKSKRVWIWGFSVLIGVATVSALPLFAVQEQVSEETEASASESLLAIWVLVVGLSAVIATGVVLVVARRAAIRRRRLGSGGFSVG